MIDMSAVLFAGSLGALLRLVMASQLKVLALIGEESFLIPLSGICAGQVASFKPKNYT
jgi:hypothetical protein